jgi:hypothetical protein
MDDNSLDSDGVDVFLNVVSSFARNDDAVRMGRELKRVSGERTMAIAGSIECVVLYVLGLIYSLLSTYVVAR